MAVTAPATTAGKGTAGAMAGPMAGAAATSSSGPVRVVSVMRPPSNRTIEFD